MKPTASKADKACAESEGGEVTWVLLIRDSEVNARRKETNRDTADDLTTEKNVIIGSSAQRSNGGRGGGGVKEKGDWRMRDHLPRRRIKVKRVHFREGGRTFMETTAPTFNKSEAYFVHAGKIKPLSTQNCDRG